MALPFPSSTFNSLASVVEHPSLFEYQDYVQHLSVLFRAHLFCEGGVDVVGVVTPLRGGAQVVLHGDQVVELSVLLGVRGRRSGRGR